MHFESKHIYHIYNQGNNRQRIFFKRENYLFFLEKIRSHVLPYADILAYCLMPNHFHLMVYVNCSEITVGVTDKSVWHSRSHPDSTKRSLNNSIGVMLRSYTRAINIQENRSGALFREETKAECLTKTEDVTPSFFNTSHGSMINIPSPDKEYPIVCFNYIHNNPVKAGLVAKAEDWEFSSLGEYLGKKELKLINRERAEEYGLI